MKELQPKEDNLIVPVLRKYYVQLLDTHETVATTEVKTTEVKATEVKTTEVKQKETHFNSLMIFRNELQTLITRQKSEVFLIFKHFHFLAEGRKL